MRWTPPFAADLGRRSCRGYDRNPHISKERICPARATAVPSHSVHHDDLTVETLGVVTTTQARQTGIPAVALRNIAAVDEDVWRIARGVYHVNDEDIDPILSDYAIGVAVGGPESFIWGHSVLALHDLACEMPRFVYVDNPRARQTRMSGFVWITRKNVPANQLTRYSGIPSTTVAQAFRDTHVDGDRLKMPSATPWPANSSHNASTTASGRHWSAEWPRRRQQGFTHCRHASPKSVLMRHQSRAPPQHETGRRSATLHPCHPPTGEQA